MTPTRFHTLLAVVALAVLVALPAQAQNVDWRLHNLDLHGSRYAEIDQITPENAHRLTPRWLFQHGVIDGVSNQTTPVVVDGGDVPHRLAGQRLRGRRLRRASSLDLRRDGSARRRAGARATSSATAA